MSVLSRGLSAPLRFRFPLIIVLAAAGFASIAICAAIGPVSIPYGEVFRDLLRPAAAHGVFSQILFQIRVPRILLGFLVGGSLAAAGAGLQGALRNPLADPYIVGTSSGAALGAAICFMAGLDRLHLVPIFAFAGAILSILAVLALSRRGGKFPVATVLLAGVVVGAFVWSLVTFLLTLTGENLQKIIFWLMGSLADRSWSDVTMMLPYALAGSAALCLLARPLNLLTLGEERAESLGLHPEKAKLAVLAAASLLTAASVAVSGLIGFVGLVVPHAVRIVSGPDHRTLIPASFLAGGILIVWSDTLARLLFQPAELPVGVVTALMGAPFFLYLLRKAKS